MGKVVINETTLTAIGDAIRTQTGGTDLIAPGDMPAEILAIEGGGTGIPEEAFNTFTGVCDGMFQNNLWGWFLRDYGHRLSSHNITSAKGMFSGSTNLESIPFELNFGGTNSYLYLGNLFNGCENLQGELKINISTADGRIPSAIEFSTVFGNCQLLRKITFNTDVSVSEGTSIYGLYSSFQYCYSLDEIKNCPFIFSTYNNSYSFGNTLYMCGKLKEFTFATKKNGGAAICSSNTAKGGTLDFKDCGYQQYQDLFFNTHFPDKEVVDDASYQALKNDPDWWTSNKAYSRYNHDSAVNTIKSLPEVVLTQKTWTLSFPGEMGSNTDGGAINTLTDAEIAVATARGWTISFT